MELYNVPRNSKIKVLDDIIVPPGAPEIKAGDEYNLDLEK